MSQSEKQQTFDSKYEDSDPEAQERSSPGQSNDEEGYGQEDGQGQNPIDITTKVVAAVPVVPILGYCCREEPLTYQGKRVQLVKVLSLTLLPIFGLWVFTVHSLNDSIEGKFDIEQTQNAVKFSVEIGIFLDRIQRERDMSVLYLSILGPETKTFLLNEYILTDEALEHLSRWPVINEFNTVFRSKQSFQDYLKDHRNKLDPNAFNIYATINFYNGLIERFVEWMYGSIKESSMASIWKVLVAYQKIVTGMEHIGIERALGTVFYVEGGLQQTWYKSYNNRVNIYKANYRSAVLYSHIVDPIFQQGVTSSGTNLTAVIESFRFEIQHSKFVEASITKGQWWFDNMTMYLDRLLLIQQELATFINGELQNIIDEEEKNLTISACFLVFVFFMCPLVIYSVEALTSDIQKYAIAMNNKTKELATEKEKIDTLLYQMVPAAVADRLKRNQAADAEYYKSVTVLSFDIDGFVVILKESTPLEIINLLNTLYTEIDVELDNHEVYKVETINDSYMVASGLPTRNGQRHSAAIANLTLTLVEMMIQRKFKAGRQNLIKLRIGIDTGPCMAGTVGMTLPRYCLFGDTINTASRMKSYSLPDKVHLSNSAASSLKKHRVFVVQYRGTIHIKGKGKMKTFWLLGKTEKKENKGVLETCTSMDTVTSAGSVAADNSQQIQVGEIEQYMPNNVWTNRYYMQDMSRCVTSGNDTPTDEIYSNFLNSSTDSYYDLQVDKKGSYNRFSSRSMQTTREAWLSNSGSKSGKKKWDGRKCSMKRRNLLGSGSHDAVHENIHEHNEGSSQDEGKDNDRPEPADGTTSTTTTTTTTSAATKSAAAAAKTAVHKKPTAAKNKEDTLLLAKPSSHNTPISAPAADRLLSGKRQTMVQAFSVDSSGTDTSDTQRYPRAASRGQSGGKRTNSATAIATTASASASSVAAGSERPEGDSRTINFSRASSLDSKLAWKAESDDRSVPREERKASWPEGQKETVASQLIVALKPSLSEPNPHPHAHPLLNVPGAGTQARLHWEMQQFNWFLQFSQPYAKKDSASLAAAFTPSVAHDADAADDRADPAAALSAASLTCGLPVGIDIPSACGPATPANSPTHCTASKQSPDCASPTRLDDDDASAEGDQRSKVDLLPAASPARTTVVPPVPEGAERRFAGCLAPDIVLTTCTPPSVSSPEQPVRSATGTKASSSEFQFDFPTATTESGHSRDSAADVQETGASDQSAFAPTDQSAFAPTDQSAFAPTDQSAFAPTDQSAFAPTDQSAFAPTDQSAFAPTDQSAFAPTDQSAFAPTDQSVVTPQAQVASIDAAPHAQNGTVSTQPAAASAYGIRKAAPDDRQATVSTQQTVEFAAVTQQPTSDVQQAVLVTPSPLQGVVTTPGSEQCVVTTPGCFQQANVTPPGSHQATVTTHGSPSDMTEKFGSQQASPTKPGSQDTIRTAVSPTDVTKTPGSQQATPTTFGYQKATFTAPGGQEAPQVTQTEPQHEMPSCAHSDDRGAVPKSLLDHAATKEPTDSCSSSVSSANGVGADSESFQPALLPRVESPPPLSHPRPSIVNGHRAGPSPPSPQKHSPETSCGARGGCGVGRGSDSGAAKTTKPKTPTVAAAPCCSATTKQPAAGILAKSPATKQPNSLKKHAATTSQGASRAGASSSSSTAFSPSAPCSDPVPIFSAEPAAGFNATAQRSTSPEKKSPTAANAGEVVAAVSPRDVAARAVSDVTFPGNDGVSLGPETSCAVHASKA